MRTASPITEAVELREDLATWSDLGGRLVRPLLLLVALFLLGTFGYLAIGWLQQNPAATLRNCVYHTAILLTGVGFSDVLESYRTWLGTGFTLFMSLMGLSLLLYTLSTITAFIVGGELTQLMEVKRMQNRIARLEGHFIICGGGETGRHVVAEFLATGRPFVLLERDRERVERLRPLGEILFLQADASDDEVLLSAGVERAAGLVTSLPEDRDNLLVVITARQLNPKLRIVSRCIDLANEKKLRKAGANAVVAANMIGGLRMASELIRPTVVSFLDTMLRDERGIRFEQVRIPEGHSLEGRTLAEANFPDTAEVNVIAVREPGGTDFHYNPRGNLVLRAGMDLVVVGAKGDLEILCHHHHFRYMP